MKMGAILKACRERKGYSQEKLAELLHMSRSCISKIENNKKAIEARTMIHWVNVTNSPEVMVAFLYGSDGLAYIQDILNVSVLAVLRLIA